MDLFTPQKQFATAQPSPRFVFPSFLFPGLSDFLFPLDVEVSFS